MNVHGPLHDLADVNEDSLFKIYSTGFEIHCLEFTCCRENHGRSLHGNFMLLSPFSEQLQSLLEFTVDGLWYLIVN